MMRILNAVVAVALGVWAWQHSTDPAGSIWMIVFGIAACWNALAAIAMPILMLKPIKMLLSMTVAGSLLMVAYFWPNQPGWWQPAMWSDPAVRPEINSIVFLLSLLVAVTAVIKASRHQKAQDLAAKERSVESRHRMALERGSLAEDL